MANEQGSDHGEDSAFSAFKNGDFSTAAKQYLPGATQGNLNSQYMLGLCLTQPGSQQEFAAAAEWFRKAAAQGHTQAYYQLGNLYGRKRRKKVNLLLCLTSAISTSVRMPLEFPVI